MVLAPRYEGTCLYPRISEKPFYVNMCIPESNDDFGSGNYKILDIGMLEF